jgi:hypothetical protein
MKLTAAQIRYFSLLEAMIDVLKDDILFDELQRTLPFAAELAEGNSKTHIVSRHAFDIPLHNQDRQIQEGDTLCGRFGPLFTPLQGLPDCPGCHAIGQALVARERMSRFPAEYFEQKRAQQKTKK